MNEQELLAVLDMSEDEQRKWLLVNVFKERMPHESNADLAFRLRDEVKGYTALWKETSLHKALLIVTKFLQCKEENRKFESTQAITYREIDWAWWAICAKPIHWIIAALIAKEKENE